MIGDGCGPVIQGIRKCNINGGCGRWEPEHTQECWRWQLAQERKAKAKMLRYLTPSERFKK